MSEYPIIKSGIFETIGTFSLILYSSITKPIPTDDKDQTLITQIQKNALCFFFLLMSFMWISHRTSGSQFNPTLTIGLFLVGGLPLSNFVMNLLSQFFGTFLAILTIQLFETGNIFARFDKKLTNIFLIEFFFSFMICVIYFMTFLHRQAPRAVFGFAVPALYSASLLALGRSHFLYWGFFTLALARLDPQISITSKFMAILAQIAGSALAAIFYKYFLENEFPKIQLFSEKTKAQQKLKV